MSERTQLRLRALCAALALGTAATPHDATAQDRLTVLSPHWEGIRYEFAEAFAARHLARTGRRVDFTWLEVGGTSDILRFIRSEFRNKPAGIDIDLFFGGGTDPYLELKKDGFLSPYRPPPEILEGVAPEVGGFPLFDPDGHWVAPTMSGFGIVYNKVVLRRLNLPEPQTWSDLARPEFFTWVGSADPRKSGSVHMSYEIMLQGLGWEAGWRTIHALGANVRAFTAGASQTPKDVALGEVAAGLAIDFYALAQVLEHGEEQIGFVLPRDLTVLNGDGLAILRGAPNPDLARAFVDFTLSEEGQLLWLLHKGEPGGPRRHELARLSVRPALYERVRGRSLITRNPFDFKPSFQYNPDLAGERWGVVNDLMGATVIDVHRSLAAVRRATRHAPDAEAAFDRFVAVPVDEAGATRLAREAWGDPATRTRTVAAWSTAARARYGAEGGQTSRALRHVPSLLVLALIAAAAFTLRRRT